MKKMLALTLAVLMCLALLAGCGGRESAKTAATNAMTALQKMDDEGMTKYFGEDASFSSSLGSDDATSQMVTAIMTGMTFQVGDVKEDGDTATANVTLTNKDMTEVINTFMTNLVTDAFSGKLTEDSMTDELSMQYFSDALAATTATVSNDVSLPMTYSKEAGWKISADATLADAMTGGFFTVLSGMQG